MPKPLILCKCKNKDKRESKLDVGLLAGEVCADVGFLRRGFLKSILSLSSLAARGGLSHSSSVLDSTVLGEGMDEDSGSFLPSLLWNGLCFALMWGSGPRGKRKRLWPSFLPLMRSIIGRITLWVSSIRGLGFWCSMVFLFGLGQCLVALFLYTACVHRGALCCF